MVNVHTGDVADYDDDRLLLMNMSRYCIETVFDIHFFNFQNIIYSIKNCKKNGLI